MEGGGRGPNPNRKGNRWGKNRNKAASIEGSGRMTNSQTLQIEPQVKAYKIVVRNLPVRDFGIEQFRAAVEHLEAQFLPPYTAPALATIAALETVLKENTHIVGGENADSSADTEGAVSKIGGGGVEAGAGGEAEAATPSSPVIISPPPHPQLGTLLSVEHMMVGHISRTQGPIQGVGFIRVGDEALYIQMAKCGLALGNLVSTSTLTLATTSATATATAANDKYPNLLKHMSTFMGRGDAIKAGLCAMPEFEPAPFHKTYRKRAKIDRVEGSYKKDALFQNFMKDLERPTGSSRVALDANTIPASLIVPARKSAIIDYLKSKGDAKAKKESSREQSKKKDSKKKERELVEISSASSRRKDGKGKKNRDRDKDRPKDNSRSSKESKKKNKKEKDRDKDVSASAGAGRERKQKEKKEGGRKYGDSKKPAAESSGEDARSQPQSRADDSWRRGAGSGGASATAQISLPAPAKVQLMKRAQPDAASAPATGAKPTTVSAPGGGGNDKQGGRSGQGPRKDQNQNRKVGGGKASTGTGEGGSGKGSDADGNEGRGGGRRGGGRGRGGGGRGSKPPPL